MAQALRVFLLSWNLVSYNDDLVFYEDEVVEY